MQAALKSVIFMELIQETTLRHFALFSSVNNRRSLRKHITINFSDPRQTLIAIHYLVKRS